MITFKQHFLLEYTEGRMPRIFSALKKDDNPYTGVHFTNWDILTFNPKPSHYDPIGVYAFPKDWVLKNGLKAQSGFRNYKHAYIVKPSSNANILNLNMDEDTARSLIKQMGLPDDLYDNPNVYHRSTKNITPGHRFWGALEYYNNQDRAPNNLWWNKLFKKTGYNVLIDPGLAIIHSNEPQQMVYLDRSSVQVINMFSNEEKLSVVRRLMEAFAKEFKVRKEYKSHNKHTTFRFTNIKNDGQYFSVVMSDYDGDVDVSVGEIHKTFYESNDFTISDVIQYIKDNLPNIKRWSTPIKDDFMLNMSKAYGLKLEGDTIKKEYKPKNADGKFTFSITHSHYKNTSQYSSEDYLTNKLYFNIRKFKGKFKARSGKVYSDDYSSSFQESVQLDLTDAHIPKTREGFDYYLEQLFQLLDQRLEAKRENYRETIKSDSLRYSSYVHSEKKSIEDEEKFIKFLKNRVFRIMS